MNRAESGNVAVRAVVVGFLTLFMLISGMMILIGVLSIPKASAASNGVAGSCGGITVSADQVQAVINNPAMSADGRSLYHAPKEAVIAAVCASAVLPDRVKDIPRLKDCRIRWQMVAAIGVFETGSGTNKANPPQTVNGQLEYFAPNGDTFGQIRSPIGAMGVYQFTPLTWNANQGSTANKFNVDANGDGQKNADNIYDEALGAALLLCDRSPGDYSTPSTASYDQVFHALQNYCAPVNPNQYSDCKDAPMHQRVDLVQALDAGTVTYTVNTAAATGGAATGSAGNCTIAGTVSAKVMQVINAACNERGDPYVGASTGSIFNFPDSYNHLLATQGPRSEWGPATERLLAKANIDPAFKAYLVGMDGKKQFDCGGLTQYAYSTVGIHLDLGATPQMGKGQPVPIDPNQMQPGDLVFFGSGSTAQHVGIYLGNDQFIDSPHTPQYVGDGNIGIRTYSSYGSKLAVRRYIDANGNPLA